MTSDAPSPRNFFLSQAAAYAQAAWNLINAIERLPLRDPEFAFIPDWWIKLRDATYLAANGLYDVTNTGFEFDVETWVSNGEEPQVTALLPDCPGWPANLDGLREGIRRSMPVFRLLAMQIITAEDPKRAVDLDRTKFELASEAYDAIIQSLRAAFRPIAPLMTPQNKSPTEQTHAQAGAAQANSEEVGDDTKKKITKRLPDNHDVRDLCAELEKNAKRTAEKKSEMEVARILTRGNERKAKNLLRQARRFTHLWKP